MIIELNGTKLAYDDVTPQDPDFDKKPALVFSHSLCMSRMMFSSQVEYFSTDRRVVSYDHRGQGCSSRDAVARLDMDTLTDDAAMLIEELELAPCHFVGSAMGGFIALRLAARRPDLLSSAVVMCSSAEEEQRREQRIEMLTRTSCQGMAGSVEPLMRVLFGRTALSGNSHPGRFDPWRERLLALDSSIKEAAQGVVHRPGVLAELANISMPLLVISGAEDVAYPPEFSDVIAALVDGARHVRVEQAGQTVVLEQPDLVNRLIAEHVTSCDELESA
jgi:3-oxoadipate enol-lactonase